HPDSLTGTFDANDDLPTSGSAVAGTIDTPPDIDLFRVALTSGSRYTFRVTLDTLPDSNLSLETSAGDVLAFNEDGNPPLDRGSRICSFVAPFTGTFFVRVQSTQNASTGKYSLAAFVDDHPEDQSGPFGPAEDLSVGGAALAGNIEAPCDKDTFRVSLDVGRSYNFEVPVGTLPSSSLKLVDSNGAVQAEDIGVTAGNAQDRAARICGFTPAAAGTFFLIVTPTGNVEGTYTISAPTDDHPDTVLGPFSGADTINVGFSGSGDVQSRCDKDLFRVSLTAGRSFTFQTTLNTLPDSLLELLDITGTIRASDDNSAGGGASRFCFTPDTSALYFVRVSGVNKQTGTYSVAVGDDDHPDLVSGSFGGADDVAVGGAATSGALGASCDVDLFRVQVDATLGYTFRTTLGTLADTTLEVLSTAGVVLATDDNSGGGLASKICGFKPSATGTVFLRVKGVSGAIGTFSVSAVSNRPPSASAGEDLNLVPGTSVTLAGAGSDGDGDTLTYAWSVTSSPAQGDATLTGSDPRQPTFTATRAGKYVLTLTVSDGNCIDGTDTLTATINSNPEVQAGPDRTLLVPGTGALTVSLPGTVTDPDGAGALTLTWTRSGGSGPTVLLQDTASATATFSATEPGTYQFTLTAQDELGGSAADDVVITLVRGTKPIANARFEPAAPILQEGGAAVSIVLDGSQSVAAAGQTITTYSWSRTGGDGPVVSLSSPSSVSPTFAATKAAGYVFSLSVSDSNGDVSANPASVTVTVVLNRRPIADAGRSTTVPILESQPVTVTLTGTASDPDSDTIKTYAWTRTGGTTPAVTLDDASRSSPSFRIARGGTQIFSLTVTDSRGGTSLSSSVTVTAEDFHRPVANAGPDQGVFLNPGGSVFVSLSGGATDADSDPIVSYSWTRDGGSGPAVELSNPASRTPNFTATAVGSYRFALVARDSRGSVSLPDTVTIEVGDPDAPLALAGPDQQLVLGPSGSRIVQLSGSGIPGPGPVVGYSWSRAGGTGNPVVLDFPTAPTPTFVVTQTGTYAFTLVVTDSTGARSINDPIVVITVTADVAPIANAGPNQSFVLSPGGSVTATLSGSGSDPDGLPIVGYRWTQVGSGPRVVLQGDTSATPSFTTTAAGSYSFALTVTDQSGTSSVNTAEITVTVTADQLPIAHAGPDQTVILGLGGAVRVQLTGTGSDADGDSIAAYFWRRSGGTGPAVILSDERSAAPNFFAVAAGTYVFALSVTDSRGGVSTNLSFVTITVVAGERPFASAGSDQTVLIQDGSATLVDLSGGGTDPDGRPIVRYAWTRAGGTGPDVTLSDATARNPRFTVVIPGTYSFGLTVFNDLGGASANPAVVTVTAVLNRLPTAVPGPNQTLFLSTGGSVVVTLGGSGSDPDADAITAYAWTRSGGTGGAVMLSDPTAASPSFVATGPGTYVFALAVTDSRGGRSINSAELSVAIEQNGRPAANAGPNQSLVLQEGSTLTVNLAGSGSDSDGTGALTYLWRRLGGSGQAVELSNVSTSSPSFLANEPGTYVFGLTVTDARGASSTNPASVQISIVLNQRPIAIAGLERTFRLEEGSSLRVTLSGESFDPDGDPVSLYSWTQAGVTGPRVTLDNAASSAPAFTATTGGTYVFALVVTDVRGGSSTNLATEQVTLLLNRRPVASAGPSIRLTVQAGQVGEITLGGSATDPDGDVVPVYAWRRAGGTGPAVTLLDSTSPEPRFIAEVPGTYTFGLVVTDARGAGSASESLVTLTVDVNRRPAVSVGGDLAVLTGRPLTLDASAFDPDGDRLLYSWALVSGPSLTVPATSAAQISVQPASPGLYVFECAADDGRGGFDKDQVAISAAAPPQARLAPVSVTPGALRVRANQLLAVNADLTNAGRATSLTAVIRFVLSGDSAIDRRDPILGRTSVGPLAPGEVRNVRGNFPVSATLAPGDYQVGVITDEVSFDAGADPSNFTKLSPGPVTVEAANLIASAVSAPSLARSGDVFAVGATVENGGNVDVTTPFRVDFLLSADRVSDVADLAVGGVLVSRLGASALAQLSAELAIPEGTPSGSYFVLASADSIALIADPVRADNVAVSASAVAVSTPATVAFAVSLAQGARLVSLPFKPSTTDGSAFTVGQLLVDGAGRPDRGIAGRVAGARFESFLQGTGQAPFAVEGGRGYVLTRTAAAAALALVGRDWPSTSLRLRLEQGTNLIGIPAIARSTLKASDLVGLTGATHVVRNGPSGRFEIFLPQLTADFTLQRGAAYLLSVPAAKTVTLPAE
ncbi:MAG: hypothetical protein HYY25_05955, partial [Candidatus Wallbacteria bacterium]|nr:hypothetical protein [Candidatus Wallbacteria bacterium]